MFSSGLISVDFIHILQGYFTGTGAIIWLPQCQWSNLEGYGWINQWILLRYYIITTTNQSTTKPHGWFVRYNVWHPCWGHGMERFPQHWPFVRRIHWLLVAKVHVQVINVFRTTSLYEGNPLVTGGFPSQRASKEEFWVFLCYQPD